jgi:transketolase
VFNADTVREKATRLRLSIIDMLTEAGSGHPGGSLSAADIVATLYFGGVLNYSGSDPDDPGRDRFLLSKGHAAPVQYAALAEIGYFDPQELMKLRKLGAMLQGHPDALTTPGIEVSTGSLGQGLSICCGMAQALKLDGGDQRVFCLLGDGELQEGQVWEAVMYAAHYRLDNLIAIVDMNRLQIDGDLDDIMSLGSIADKFSAFGWEVHEVDGHDITALHQVLTLPATDEVPCVIIAHTVKGQGVSFMENKAGWHGVCPDQEQRIQALEEIEQATDEGVL